MNKLHGGAVGLATGVLVALGHVVWAVTVGTMPDVALKFLNFKFAMHFVSMPVTLQAFSWGGVIALVVYSFVVGYIAGRVFATVYNLFARK